MGADEIPGMVAIVPSGAFALRITSVNPDTTIFDKRLLQVRADGIEEVVGAQPQSRRFQFTYSFRQAASWPGSQENGAYCCAPQGIWMVPERLFLKLPHLL